MKKKFMASGCSSLRLLDDELHRAGAHVVHGTGRCHRGLAHLLAQLGRHAGCGGFFQHLLVAALHGTVALEQVHAVAMRVAKHLDLNVARALHVLFDQHRVVAKAVDGFALARCSAASKSSALSTARMPLPPPPALALMSTG
jgi:hypothetical protein